MITSSNIYWITRLDALSNFLIGLIILFCTIAFIYIVVGLCSWIENEFDKYKKCFRWFVYALCGVTLCGFVNTMLPTTKEMIAIYAVPGIINNEQVQEVPVNITSYINEQLKAWTEKIKGE